MSEYLREYINGLNRAELKQQLTNLINEINRADIEEDRFFNDEFMPRYEAEKKYIIKRLSEVA